MYVTGILKDLGKEYDEIVNTEEKTEMNETDDRTQNRVIVKTVVLFSC